MFHLDEAPDCVSLEIVVNKIFSGKRTKYTDLSNVVEDLAYRLSRNIEAIPGVKSAKVDTEDRERVLENVLGAASWVYEYSWHEVIRVSIPVMLAIGAYAGKKTLDVVTDIVKAEVTKKMQEEFGEAVKVEIFGPDGNIVTVVRVPKARNKSATS
jgi:hypothetical protein